MNPAAKTLRLLTVQIRFEQDVVLARQRARQLAGALGFESQIQTRLATALSEIARNAFQYAGGGRVEFSVVTEPHPSSVSTMRQTLVIEVRDTGPGIARLEDILGGRYRSTTGLGVGLIGTQRLMDSVDIATSPQGTTITLSKILPPTAASRSPHQLQAIVDELSRRPPAGAVEEIQVQNQELLRAMEEAQARQEELARVNWQLAEAGRENEKLLETVTRANEAKDQFFAMLSHELRTPLNPALAIVSSMEGDSRVPEELRDDISIVGRNIRLEARLIDDLLDFNRLLKGKLVLREEALDMHALIGSVIDICRTDWEAKRQTVIATLDSPRSTIIGDSARLQQVLWNVLKNAIKFTPPEGSIEIRTAAMGSTMRIDIIDTGRGLGADAAERIFNAFDQGQADLVAVFGGLGLGLAIARMFVDLHRGKISAFSRGLGHGTTITVDLPLTAEPVTAPAPASLPSVPLVNLTGRILLIDDHPDTLVALSRLLTRRGFDVTGAATGEEALTAARRSPFDLFISDLGLPDIPGKELMPLLQKIQALPAIAVSGYGMEADVLGSETAGFRFHLRSPSTSTNC